MPFISLFFFINLLYNSNYRDKMKNTENELEVTYIANHLYFLLIIDFPSFLERN